MSVRLIATLVLGAPLLATLAYASGQNEYTLSNTQNAVPTYQAQQMQPSFQAQQPYQPQMNDNTAQFGEIVYDSQPYVPNATTGTTQTYTTNTGNTGSVEAYATQPYTTQPYVAPADTTYQPAYQAAPVQTYQDAQSVYQPPQPEYRPPQPAYLPQPAFQSGNTANDGASWK